jgi:hypothetical protein
LEVQTDLFPAGSIAVLLDGEEIHDLKKLEWVAEEVAKQWHEKTGNMRGWKQFKTQRDQAASPTEAKPKPVNHTSALPAKMPSGERVEQMAAPLKPGTRIKTLPAEVPDPEREWPANKPINLAMFHKVITGKPPCVHKQDVVQFRGIFIKAYLHVTLPDWNPPPQHMQDEWLDAVCSVVLANHLAKEPLQVLLGVFQDDALALRDWAKEKVAAAIWQNLELQEELPRTIAASSPRLRQIWHQECVKYFPSEAREKVAKAVASIGANAVGTGAAT